MKGGWGNTGVLGLGLEGGVGGGAEDRSQGVRELGS